MVGVKRTASQSTFNTRPQSLTSFLDSEQLSSAQILSDFLRNKIQKQNESLHTDQHSALMKLLQDKLIQSQDNSREASIKDDCFNCPKTQIKSGSCLDDRATAISTSNASGFRPNFGKQISSFANTIDEQIQEKILHPAHSKMT
jgi:hypothetical protein